MKRSPKLTCPRRVSFMVICSVTMFIIACGKPSGIKVGLGETVINPPIGTPMSGYMRTEVSKGIHDDLHARSLVVEGKDGAAVVLMTLSLVDIGKDSAYPPEFLGLY